MRSAQILKSQIESAFAHRVPYALTPAAKVLREVTSTGVSAVDELIGGGLPAGALTEMIGTTCSGRTTLALSFLAQVTQAEKVCAWIDASDTLSPESAAASHVDLTRFLWVRCGVSSQSRPAARKHQRQMLPEEIFLPAVAKKGLHGGGLGPHPRSETKGLSEGVSGLLRPLPIAQGLAGPPHTIRREIETLAPVAHRTARTNSLSMVGRPLTRIEQALRVTDLLLQAGGFSSIVLDLGSITPQHVLRVPLSTWFRYRAAAERSQASVLLLTQHACSKSSAGLVLRLESRCTTSGERTVLTCLERSVEILRQRSGEQRSGEQRYAELTPKVVTLRKPPQNANASSWHSRSAWVAIP